MQYVPPPLRVTARQPPSSGRPSCAPLPSAACCPRRRLPRPSPTSPTPQAWLGSCSACGFARSGQKPARVPGVSATVRSDKVDHARSTMVGTAASLDRPRECFEATGVVNVTVQARATAQPGREGRRLWQEEAGDSVLCRDLGGVPVTLHEQAATNRYHRNVEPSCDGSRDPSMQDGTTCRGQRHVLGRGRRGHGAQGTAPARAK